MRPVVKSSRRYQRHPRFERLEHRELLAFSPTLLGAHLIYNNSSYDGNDATVNAGDDAAIVPNKAWLLPGKTATFANYTSYDKGINSLAIDIANLGPSPTVADFNFKVGTTPDPATWADAPAPSAFDVRRGAGASGADRVTVNWADGAIKNTWLQVTLLASGNVFYFGNAVGETGNSPANAFVSAADEIGVRTHATPVGQSATIDSAYDFNRDGAVDAADELFARSNRRLLTGALPLFIAPHVAALNVVATSDSPTVGLAGEVVHYEYELHNTGSTPLTNVTLVANLGTAELRQTDLAGDDDNVLEVGEIWRYTGTLTVTQQQITAGAGLANTVTADSDQTSADADDTVLTIASLEGDTLGNVIMRPVTHASFVLVYKGKTIYVDPDGAASLYAGIPRADFVLITHEHGDHFDAATISAIANAGARIIAPQVVFNAMSAAMKNLTTVIDYNAATTTPDTLELFDEMNDLLFSVEAVPAYNGNHPVGRGNGYVVTIDAKRIYIAGDTGNQPELRALENIDIAFVSMNTPFTMTPADAMDLVRAMKPRIVYPYHYRNSNGNTGNAIIFKNLMSTDFSIEVRLRKWY
jgi:L-ascorbate metabolism protein UlaG (beta-lactamase superfamily)